jgi:hypothetical protein
MLRTSCFRGCAKITNGVYDRRTPLARLNTNVIITTTNLRNMPLKHSLVLRATGFAIFGGSFRTRRLSPDRSVDPEAKIKFAFSGQREGLADWPRTLELGDCRHERCGICVASS